MEWTSRGIVLGTRKHSETDVILEVMTPDRGRHLGLVRGGRSKRHRPALQPGNELQLTWKARLSQHLGAFTIDPVRSRAAELMASSLALHGVQHLAELLRSLPERDAHQRLYEALQVVLDHLGDAEIAGPLIVRFELALLEELGFGLDLSACAATGRMDDLAYVSPKSARAVSREAGRPYHDKLLPLPPFLADGQRQPGSEIPFHDIRDGLTLTGFFLERNLSANDSRSAGGLRTQLQSSLEAHFRKHRPWEFL
ncbi:DNA replication and repair protein RecO [Roseibium hamelinense]|uniref:DNA repair protein RecO n=1 Tax=Roseibium hamelinense TaxID=150831 RepID=A0A562TGX3_9HYPH|nr:DNA repair protein RecO [Roseibium hamelinense]MTI42378.1 DNA repair protein RecO [Roseibium hamelinense]TWI92583.1 DNA replication and repair protein RecO [Roseibium hamelinense]